MANGYILPAVRIAQEFAVILDSEPVDLNALLIGPQYDFLKYSDPDDRATALVGDYDKDTDTTILYPGRVPGAAVDQDSVQVIFDEIEAEYFEKLPANVAYQFKADPTRLNRLATTFYSTPVETPATGHSANTPLLTVGGIYRGDIPNELTNDYDIVVTKTGAPGVAEISFKSPSVTGVSENIEGFIVPAYGVFFPIGSRGVHIMFTQRGTLLDFTTPMAWTFTADTSTRLNFKSVTNSNGDVFARSADFKSRDVKVGDVVEITGIAGSPAGPVTLRSEVKTLVQEQLSSVIDGAIAGANQVTQPEFIGGPLGPTAGTADASGANTGDQALDVAAPLGYTGDLVEGTLTDTYIVTITRGGFPGDVIPPLASVVSASGEDDVATLTLNQGYSILIDHGAVVGGPFVVGNKLRGVTSLAEGVITEIVGASDTRVSWLTGAFEVGETLAEFDLADVATLATAGAIVDLVATSGPYAIGTRGLEITFRDTESVAAQTSGDTMVVGDFWKFQADRAFNEVLAESNHTRNVTTPVIDAAINPYFPNEIYRGLQDTIYTVRVIRGGIFGSASVRITSTGDDSSGPTPIDVPFEAPVAVAGNLGTQIGTAAPFVPDILNTQDGGAGLAWRSIHATDSLIFQNVHSVYIGPPDSYTVEVLTAGSIGDGVNRLIFNADSNEDDGDPLGITVPDLTEFTSVAGDISGTCQVITGAETIVVGVGTAFLTEVNVGDLFHLALDTAADIAIVESVDSDTQLTLRVAYVGATLDTLDDYHIFTPTPVPFGTRGMKFAFPAELGSSVLLPTWTNVLRAAAGAVGVDDLIEGDKWTIQCNAIPVGSKGVYINFQKNDQNGFVANDSWTIGAESVKGGPVIALDLKDNIPADLVAEQTDLEARLYLTQQDVVLTQFRVEDPLLLNYIVGPDTVILTDAIRVTDASWYDAGPVLVDIPVDAARVHITYRALRTDKSATVHTVETTDDVLDQVGRKDPLNPMSFGLHKALENSQGRPVKYITVATDDQTGYDGALEITRNFDDVYSFVPLTQNTAIHSIFSTHVTVLSTKLENKWRIALINQALTTETPLFDQKPNSSDPTILEDYLATITADALTGEFTVLEAIGTNFITKGVVPGDSVRTNYSTDLTGTVVWETHEVAEVISQTVLTLRTGPAVAVSTASKFKIYRPLSLAQQAQQIADVSSSFANRRVFNVWPDVCGTEGLQVEGFYLCAAIAGMIAAFPAHQGFTNVTLAGFDDVERSFVLFTQVQLNVIAGGGTYIVTQDVIGGVPYTRHQVSTDNESLFTRELNITKNLDSMSYYFKDLLAPLIGRSNVTETLLAQIRATFVAGIDKLVQNRYPRIGPQLLGATIKKLEQDPNFKDRVIVEIVPDLPVPLNNLDVTLLVGFEQ